MVLMLVTGAAVTFAVGLVHSWLGEKYILGRLFRRQDLPRLFGSDWFTRRTLRFAWHLTSIAWWGFGSILLVYAASETGAARSAVLVTISLTFLLSAIVAAGFTRGRHLSWIAFLAIAALCWFAVKPATSPQSQPHPQSQSHLGQTEACRVGEAVLAISRTLDDPTQEGALAAVTDLGHETRYYILVRGWLVQELAGCEGIESVGKPEVMRPELEAKIAFLKRAIRVIDLE